MNEEEISGKKGASVVPQFIPLTPFNKDITLPLQNQQKYANNTYNQVKIKSPVDVFCIPASRIDEIPSEGKIKEPLFSQGNNKQINNFIIFNDCGSNSNSKSNGNGSAVSKKVGKKKAGKIVKKTSQKVNVNANSTSPNNYDKFISLIDFIQEKLNMSRDKVEQIPVDSLEKMEAIMRENKLLKNVLEENHKLKLLILNNHNKKYIEDQLVEIKQKIIREKEVDSQVETDFKN